MKKILILAICLSLTCIVILNMTGCGTKEEQETETSGKVEVPDVTGLSADDAKEALKANDLDCSVEEEKVTDKGKDGKVLSQDPEPGTMLTPDMTVYITVGKL